MDVQIEDISEKIAALALQGPTSGKLLKSVAEADIANLKYFRMTSGKIAGVPVDISRTGYTGDLGYEIWMPWDDAVKVWDALMDAGRRFDIHAAGMLALDVARIEAGLMLIEVDYISSKKALIDVAEVFAVRNRLRQDGAPGEREFRRQGSAGSSSRSRAWRGNWSDWKWIGWRWKNVMKSSGLHRRRRARLRASHVPVYRASKQVGKATSTTWSPMLKKMIALASVETAHAQAGNQVADGDHH